MSKYQIRIDYITGDSFHSDNATDVLEMEWENLEVVKQNLIRIREHYTCYGISRTYNGVKWAEEEDQVLFNGRWKKDWHVPGKYKGEEFNSIKLGTDNGAGWIIGTFWTGHFESLRSIEIIVAEEKGMKIIF